MRDEYRVPLVSQTEWDAHHAGGCWVNLRGVWHYWGDMADRDGRCRSCKQKHTGWSDRPFSS